MSKTTIEASDLKDNLEDQGIACNNSTIASTDAEDFYPSVRLKPVRKVVCHFSKIPLEEDQINIEHCWCAIKFGIQFALLTFTDKCYEHDGERDPKKKGLLLVDVNQSGWQIQQGPKSQTRPNHTSGKTNPAAWSTQRWWHSGSVQQQTVLWQHTD